MGLGINMMHDSLLVDELEDCLGGVGDTCLDRHAVILSYIASDWLSSGLWA